MKASESMNLRQDRDNRDEYLHPNKPVDNLAPIDQEFLEIIKEAFPTPKAPEALISAILEKIKTKYSK